MVEACADFFTSTLICLRACASSRLLRSCYPHRRVGSPVTKEKHGSFTDESKQIEIAVKRKIRCCGYWLCPSGLQVMGLTR